MKKKTLLIVSTSFALGVGVIGSGVGALLHQKASTPGVMEDATLPSDEIGARVRLGAEGDATTDPTVAAPTFVNTLGYRLIDEESGAKSIRVYAVLNGYKGLNSASVTRKVEDSTGASVMKEKTIEFGYVYSSIKDAESVTWDDALPAETDTTKNYFVVFTLKNIPEAHWLDKLSVTFAVDNGAIVKSAEALANVKGLMEQEVGVGVTLAQAESGVIFAMKKHSAITEAVVPENYYTYEGHVATFVGKVTRLGDPKKQTSGAFESCSSLTSVTLPDTIAEMGGWTFGSSPKLTTVRLPRDLTTVHSNCWNSSSTIKTIYWDAVNFVNDKDATFTGHLDEIIVSANVQSLPKRFLYSSSTVKKVTYKGTLAQWEALKTAENKDNGLFIDNVFATDNVCTVTYHLPEGVTLNGQSGEVKVNFIKNKVASFGIALKDGMKFDGWYTDSALSTALDTTAPVTTDLNLYPKFVEFGPGISEAKPIVLGEENKTFTETLLPGHEEVYFKYTAPVDATAGWRYVRINEKASTTNTDMSVGVSELGDQKVSFYKDSISDENAIAESTSTSPTDTAKVQRIGGDDGYKRVWVEPGQTYVIVADAYSGSNQDNHWYGDLVVEWIKGENDSVNTALDLTFGQEYEFRPAYKRQSLPMYKYTPTASKNVAMYLTSHGGLSGSLYCYEVIDGGLKSMTSVYSYSGVSSKQISLEANHTYVFYFETTDVASEDKYFSFSVDNLPAGAELANPIAYEIGTDVTVSKVASQDVFYSFTLDAEQTIRITIEDGSSSTAKYLKVLSTDGTELADAGSETPDIEDDGWGYGDTTETYGRNPLVLSTKLAAGTYIIKTGYTSGSSFTKFKMTSKIMLPGDSVGDPLTAEVNAEGVTTLTAVADGKFYKATATQAGYMQFDVASTNGGKLYLVDSAGKVISSAANGQFFYSTVKVGDVVLLKAADAADTLTVTITYPSEIHDGKTRETAFALDFSGKETVDITFATGSSRVDAAFFKFTVATSGVYRIYSQTGAVDVDVNAVYEGSETTKIPGTYTNDDRGNHIPYTSNSNDFYSEVSLEAGKVYYLSLRLYTNNDNSTVLLGMSKLKAGDALKDPLTSSWSGNSMVISGNSGVKYYSFTETEGGSYDLTATSSVEGVTPTISVFSGEREITGQTDKKNRFDFEAGKKYVIKVGTAEACDVTITRTVYTGVFTGSPAFGSYCGSQNGSSYYYYLVVTSDKVMYDSATGYAPTSGPTTTDGITTFEANGKNYYTNGTDAIASFASYNGTTFCFFSKRLNIGTRPEGQIGYTSDASMTSGVVIQSILIDDGSRIYSVVKDGTIYFGATVEFAEGETGNIGGSTKPFTVKDASGTVIGTYSCSNKILTEVTSPAA